MSSWSLFSLISITLPAAAGVATAGPDTVTAFVHVAVVPMDRERVLRDQTVVVQGDRIVAFGPAKKVTVPAGAVRVDGRGKFLIPGLADMHVHLLGEDTTTMAERLAAYVANGVTTVRDMHGGARATRTTVVNYTQDYGLALKRRLARGELLGPRLYTAGDHDVTSLAAMMEGIAELKADGHDFVKIYDSRPIREAYGRWPASKPFFDSLLVAAKRAGLRVVGHLPRGIDPTQLAAPWASTEHLYEYTEYLLGLSNVWSKTDGGEMMSWRQDVADTAVWMQPGYQLDPVRLRHLAETLKQQKIWSCPTVGFRMKTLRMADSTEHMGDFVTSVPKRYAAFDFQIIKALQTAGAGLLLGTDEESPFAVHDDLTALVQGPKLTPYEALATATRQVAEFLGTLDSTGTVAVGKRADLVLLAGNPLRDIGYTAGPAGVMVGGRWLPRAELEAYIGGAGAPTPTTEKVKQFSAHLAAERQRVWRH